MDSQRCRHRPELYPARQQFAATGFLMASYVMCPEEASGVAARYGKFYLKRQHVPVGVCVAREVERMAVVTPSAPAAVGGATLAVSEAVAVKNLVEPRKCACIGSRYVGIDIVLLPVDPPKVKPEAVGRSWP